MKKMSRLLFPLLASVLAACGSEAPGLDGADGSEPKHPSLVDPTELPASSPATPTVLAPVASDVEAQKAFAGAVSTELDVSRHPLAGAASTELDVSRDALARRMATTRFDWERRCTVLGAQPAEGGVRTLALLPGDAVDGTTVTDVDWSSVARQMRHFNGKFTAFRLYQSTLDQIGIGRVRQLIEEFDLLYSAKTEVIGIEPQGTQKMTIVAVPAVEDVCAGGYACAYQNSRTIWVQAEAINATDMLTAISHEMDHAFDRLSAHLFTQADFAHSWTEVLDPLTLAYLQRDENPHPNAQGITPLESIRDRRWDRLAGYEAFPGANWQNCINLQSCDPAGEATAQGLSVHTQAGVALRVFELYGGNQPLKRWLTEAQSLSTTRGYVWDTLTREQRREFLIESLSRGAQANLSCFFDNWSWPVSTTLRNTLTSLYGSTNAFCNDADGDGFSRLRYDCNDSNNSIRPNATESTNGVDDDCDGVIDDALVQESGDFQDDQNFAQLVPFPVHIRGNLTTFDRDAFRINVPTAQTVRLYFRSLQPSTIVDVFDQGNLNNWTSVHAGAWRSGMYKIHLQPGDWRFLIFGFDPGPYEIFVHPDTSLPVQMPDGWPTTYTPNPASNPSANQYVIPAPPIPPALAGTPNLQVRHFISDFGFVGPAAANSSFTWVAPAGTNAKGLHYRSQFVTGSSGPPVWPLSQYQSLVTVPSNWLTQDIGSVSTPGSVKRWFENFTVDGAGTGISGSNDSFRYTWVRVSGNANIVARVVSLENTSSSALAGVAIRENLNANARNAVVAVTPGNSMRFQRRTSTGGSTSTTTATESAVAPRWVRLERSGNTFRAYRSTNGTSWTQIGSNTSITMGTTVHVGLAVTSANSANLATGVIDAVNVTGTIVP